MATKKQTKGKVKQSPVLELFMTRDFDAPREILWDAWTKPEILQRWWGPREFITPVAEIDLRIGGNFTYCMRSPQGQDFWGIGTYKEIEPPERLLYFDSFADKDGNIVPASYYGITAEIPEKMLVEVTIEEIGEKTRLTLKHLGFPKGKHFDGATMGWSQSLDKLEEVVRQLSVVDIAEHESDYEFYEYSTEDRL